MQMRPDAQQATDVFFLYTPAQNEKLHRFQAQVIYHVTFSPQLSLKAPSCQEYKDNSSVFGCFWLEGCLVIIQLQAMNEICEIWVQWSFVYHVRINKQVGC